MTHALPAVALVGPDDGTLVGALMAVDRLVVATGLLVLLGGAGLVAVARLPTPAWRLTRRVEGRARWLLVVAWWATVLGTLAGLLLHGPFTAGLPLSRALDATLLQETLRTRFGGVWAVRACCCSWLPSCEPGRSGKIHGRAPAPGWRLECWRLRWRSPPALSGHAAGGPDAAVGAVVGVLHFSATAVWFGGVVLLGTCVLPHPDAELLAAAPRFSSVAFTAMVVIVVTGMVQGWRQLGSLQALGQTAYGRLLVAKVAVFLLLIAVAARSRAGAHRPGRVPAT